MAYRNGRWEPNNMSCLENYLENTIYELKKFGVEIEIENEKQDGCYSVSVNGKYTEQAMTTTGVCDALSLMSVACEIAYETGKAVTHKIF